MPDLSGQSIGRYHIVAPLGEGGMATVYKAFDTRLECDVAIKFIRKENVPSSQWERMIVRFEREAKRMAKFTHPNIVKVNDYGEYQTNPYLVMEYLPGGTLKELLKARRGKPIPYQEAARILAPVARALQYAHEEETIHRDVKPANILLTKGGQPMLTDFGVAKILDLDEGQTLTGTGVGVGTPKYMAPEQWKNRVLPQTDIYALGVVFYEMITGNVPFDAETPAGVLEKQLTEPLVRPIQFVPGLPEDVERVVFKALARKPEDRYADMVAMAEILEKLAQGTLTQQSLPVAVVGNESTIDYVEGDQPPEPHTPSSSAQSAQSDKSAVQTSSDQFTQPHQSRAQTTIDYGSAPASAQSVWQTPHSPIPPHSQSGQHPQAETKQEKGKKKIGLFLAGLIGLMTLTLIVIYNYTPSHAETVTPIKTQLSAKDGMEQVYIPEGEFLMGSNDGNSDERPEHKVYLDAFWIDKTEVTNAMYRKCVESGICEQPNCNYSDSQKNDHPVVCVDWNQAHTYCQWAGGRLPSEAEWEKAARGTDGRTYPWGENIDCGRANYGDGKLFGQKCIGDTSEVGKYPSGASPYGAMDMAGNVWEWVNDWYDGNYYQNSAQRNPTGPGSGQYRVQRGGSWDDVATNVRAAYRNWNYPVLRYLNGGFRCVR